MDVPRYQMPVERPMREWMEMVSTFFAAVGLVVAAFSVLLLLVEPAKRAKSACQLGILAGAFLVVGSFMIFRKIPPGPKPELQLEDRRDH